MRPPHDSGELSNGALRVAQCNQQRTAACGEPLESLSRRQMFAAYGLDDLRRVSLVLISTQAENS